MRHRAAVYSWMGVFAALAGASALRAETRLVHAFVALADNASQGIVPVPAKIGNGDDADANLYWGCDEGLRSLFKKSSRWRFLESQPATGPLLERCIFRHRTKDAILVADAYRGREIRTAIEDFLNAAAGVTHRAVKIDGAEIKFDGAAELVAYIGHNGLMDFRMEGLPAPKSPVHKPCIVLCCKSEEYFAPLLRSAGAVPLLTTTQLMYPGSFLLHDALESWLEGGGAGNVRQKAAEAYARNQKISVKAALGVFEKRENH